MRQSTKSHPVFLVTISANFLEEPFKYTADSISTGESDTEQFFFFRIPTFVLSVECTRNSTLTVKLEQQKRRGIALTSQSIAGWSLGAREPENSAVTRKVTFYVLPITDQQEGAGAKYRAPTTPPSTNAECSAGGIRFRDISDRKIILYAHHATHLNNKIPGLFDNDI